MDNKDNYAICTKIGLICYLKNGKPHRELGPAMFPAEYKSKYSNLGDSDLYSNETTEYDIHWKVGLSIALKSAEIDKIGYYLDGVQYEKQVWESLIEKKKLNKDLNDNLAQTENQSKKLKI